MNNYALVIRPHNRITANISGLSKLWYNVRSEILPHNSQVGFSCLRRIILDDILSLDSGQCQSWLKISLVPQQTFERLHQWANGQQFTLRREVSCLESADDISSSLSLTLSSQGCSCSILVSLERGWHSLQQVSVSCVKPPKLMSRARTANALASALEQLAMPNKTPTRFLQGWLGRQLSSWTFSNASTHTSLKGEL